MTRSAETALRTTRDGQTAISLWVVPKSSREGFVGLQENTLKIAVTAPPSDGEANAAVIRLIASLLGISKGRVVLKSGASSRRKVVEVPLDISTVEALLNVHLKKD